MINPSIHFKPPTGTDCLAGNLLNKRTSCADYISPCANRMNSDTLMRPGINHQAAAKCNCNMTAVINHIAALNRARAHGHKDIASIPIHGIVGLAWIPAMVIRVVNTHIHASSIKALQDKTRAINSSTGSGRPRLNILRTDILIGALDKGVHAIFPRCFDRNARRGHLGKVSGAIARQLNSPRTDLRILGWILPANFVALAIAPENSANTVDGPCARCHSAAAV